jgi:hypothetical protein
MLEAKQSRKGFLTLAKKQNVTSSTLRCWAHKQKDDIFNSLMDLDIFQPKLQKRKQRFPVGGWFF